MPPPHAATVAAETKRAEIARGLAHPTIAWGAPPHAFQCEQVIALYPAFSGARHRAPLGS